jgi:hypothetical protein
MGYFYKLKKLLQVNNRPIGENSPNLQPTLHTSKSFSIILFLFGKKYFLVLESSLTQIINDRWSDK